MFQTAKQFNTRPSELLGVADPWTAYCLDNAVAHFGTSLEAELESITGKTDGEITKKRKRTMEKWLGIEPKYRSPMSAKGGSKMDDVVHDVTVQGGID